jgi:sugar fermentation stimulation protein A
MKQSNMENNRGRIRWPHLVRGTLIKRYKRFMADVKLKNGHVVTAHCPNSGSMLECSEPGRLVFLSRHNNPGRRLKYTWEMIEMPTSLVGANTGVPNKLVRAAIEAGQLPALSGYDGIRSEVGYGRNSRVDLLLKKGEAQCFVEIKNCTLVREGVASFPDAVTTRGLKHLVELQDQVRLGNRSVIFFLVQRMDAIRFRPADLIDPAYGRELRRAAENGVEVLVYDVILDLEGIVINRGLLCEL